MNLLSPWSGRKFLTYLLLFLAGLVVFSGASFLISVPGYMDAEYYFMGGKNLASGYGFNEMVIWNYLDEPAGLPNLSHTYWMPLSSILTAAGIVLFNLNDFLSAKIVFILLAAGMPVITYGLALRIYNDKNKALLSAVLAFFPGFYLPYLLTTDTVTPYILFGGVYSWLLLEISSTVDSHRWTLCFFLLGAIAGLMHLTRSDGLLWLVGALIAPAWIMIFSSPKQLGFFSDHNKFKLISSAIFSVIFGYLIAMGPWMLRNLQHFGSPLAPGGFSTLWMTDYNQLFIYPASNLSFTNWISSGLWHQIILRIKALSSNLVSLLAVEGEIILFPFIIMGAVKLKKLRALHIIQIIWLLTFVLMSIIFPFAGTRGGFLHASAGFHVFFLCLIPAGFHSFIEWGIQKRNWERKRSERGFKAMLFAAVAVLTAFLFYTRVIGQEIQFTTWQRGWENYEEIEKKIELNFPDKSQIIIVNNPPGYYLASGGRWAIVIPEGDENTLRAVAARYQAQILAVDHNIVPGLKSLYNHPESKSWLTYLYTINDTHIYKVALEDGK